VFARRFIGKAYCKHEALLCLHLKVDPRTLLPESNLPWVPVAGTSEDREEENQPSEHQAQTTQQEDTHRDSSSSSQATLKGQKANIKRAIQRLEQMLRNVKQVSAKLEEEKEVPLSCQRTINSAVYRASLLVDYSMRTIENPNMPTPCLGTKRRRAPNTKEPRASHTMWNAGK